eukprot:2625271-Rhodomonas_salina.4
MINTPHNDTMRQVECTEARQQLDSAVELHVRDQNGHCTWLPMRGYRGILSHLPTTELRDVVKRAPEEIPNRSRTACLSPVKLPRLAWDSPAALCEQQGSTLCMTMAPIFGPRAQTPPISESTLPTVNLPSNGLHGSATRLQWSSSTPVQWTEQCLGSHLLDYWVWTARSRHGQTALHVHPCRFERKARGVKPADTDNTIDTAHFAILTQQGVSLPAIAQVCQCKLEIDADKTHELMWAHHVTSNLSLALGADQLWGHIAIQADPQVILLEAFTAQQQASILTALQEYAVSAEAVAQGAPDQCWVVIAWQGWKHHSLNITLNKAGTHVHTIPKGATPRSGERQLAGIWAASARDKAQEGTESGWEDKDLILIRTNLTSLGQQPTLKMTTSPSSARQQ